MPTLVVLGIYAALALGAIAAVWGAKHSYDNGIRNDQIAKDTVILEQVKTERENVKKDLAVSRQREKDREAETAACAAAAAEQSKAVNDLDRRGQAALAASRKIIAEANARATANANQILKLRGLAEAPPATDQTCQETLARTDAILRSMVRTKGATK